MKVLTMNIHSHYDKMDKRRYRENITLFADHMCRLGVDVAAIQECGQTHDAPEAAGAWPGIFCPCSEDTVIREDNCAYLIVKELEQKGLRFYWSWCNAKIGYGRFDEGLAILSKEPILAAEEFYISRIHDFYNWKTRKALGVKLPRPDAQWVYCVHMGWWDDPEEPFAPQMECLQIKLKEKKGNIFLMGDFNSRAGTIGEGYDYVKNLGWKDTYELAVKKDGGITVPGTIDGWKGVKSGMRIDYIWTREEKEVFSSEIVFNGEKQPVISDHFGVIMTTENTGS